MLYYW